MDAPEPIIQPAKVTGRDAAGTGWIVANSGETYDQSPSIAQTLGAGCHVTALTLNRQLVILGIGGYAQADG